MVWGRILRRILTHLYCTKDKEINMENNPNNFSHGNNVQAQLVHMKPAE